MATKSNCELFAELEAVLAKIDVAAIPVSIIPRTTTRKDFAVATRALFKSLGISRTLISVTTPNYSMASSIHIAPVTPDDNRDVDYVLNGVDYKHHCYSDMPANVPARKKMQRATDVRNKITEIMNHTFINMHDRSDSQSDYFDYCWNVH